jgi:hypothetical protein
LEWSIVVEGKISDAHHLSTDAIDRNMSQFPPEIVICGFAETIAIFGE